MRLFRIVFHEDSCEWFVLAKDQKAALDKFINRVKENIGEMADYDIERWEEIIHIVEETEFYIP